MNLESGVGHSAQPLENVGRLSCRRRFAPSLRRLQDSRPTRSGGGAAWLAAVALVVLVAATYALAAKGGFVWDDDQHVTANPTIIGPLGLADIWSSAHADYFPLVLTTFWAEHALWGLDPLGYHLVTIACHALAAVLLWRVLRALLIRGAWLGAALWAVHPVQVESVAWISELKNTESAVFFLAALLLFLRWAAPPPEAYTADAPVRRWTYAAALLAGILALLCKSSTVMLPVTILLCLWWRGLRLNRRLIAAVVPLFALSAIAAGWTIWEQKVHSGAAGPEWSQSAPERVAIAGRVVWFYLGKLAWPQALNFIYPRWTVAPASPLAYLPAALALGVLVALARLRRFAVARAVFFALAAFGVLLFPVLGFFDVYFFRYAFVADHFQYLAAMAPLALGAAALATTRPGRVFAGGVLVALAAASAWRCLDYRDSETLWRRTVARNPGATMAWVNLGDTLAKHHHEAEALRCFARALALKPGMADVANDMGCTLILAHRPAEALARFERAEVLQPGNAEVHNNVGNALRMLGRADEALVEYRRAVALAPDYVDARNNLGAELAARGALTEALPHFAAALRRNPQQPDTENRLANALRRLGRREEALGHFRRAVALQPGSAELHRNLGAALAELGRLDAALPELEAAVKLDPGSTGNRQNYAAALGAAKRWSDAAAQFERLVELQPGFATAQAEWAIALVNSGDLAGAVPHFEASLRLDPNQADVSRALTQVLRALGR